MLNLPIHECGMSLQVFTSLISSSAFCNFLHIDSACVLLDLYLSIFFNIFIVEYNCFTVVCQFLLYNKVNQLYVYLYPHIPSLLCLPPTLPIPPLQVVTKQRADLPVLCSCFSLAIYFTFGSVYMSMTYVLKHFVFFRSVVNGIASFIFLSSCSFSVYRNEIGFFF